MTQCDIALKLVVEVMRGVGHAAAEECRRSVQNVVVRSRPLVYRSGINKRLKGRTYLALGLRGAVEFGLLKIAPADHGFDVARSIINRQQGPLGGGILLQQHSRTVA